MGLSKEFKIGAVIIAAIAALFIGIQYLKGNDLLSNSRTFYGIYSRTAGLAVGNPVTLSDHQIGQIKRIDFFDPREGTLLVEFNITDKSIPVPSDTKARIQSTDLLGSMSIALYPGLSEVEASNRDTLATTIEKGLVDEVNQQIAPLKLKAESLLASVDSVMVITEQLLREDARPNLTKSFESIRRTLESIENTSNNLDQLLSVEKGALMSIIENTESVTSNLKDNNEALTNIIGNFSSMSDSLAQVDVAAILGEAADAVASLSQMMKDIEMGEGSMGLLLNDDSLYNNLNMASANLDALLEDIRIHPDRYVSFSVINRKQRDEGFTKREIEEIQRALDRNKGKVDGN
jgi:phospholipid/cholesterol/gamma-HCH transport system substrate-binding protein